MTSQPAKPTRKPALTGAELIAQDIEAARLRLKERRRYVDIAEILGFKEEGGARDAVKRHLKREGGDVEQARLEIVSDLQEVANLLLEAIRDGKLEKSDPYVRVIERIVKIEGIDAPVKLDLQTTPEQEKAEAEEILGKFKLKAVESEAS